MIFGALAGAREVLMIDAHGGEVRKSRSNVLLNAPARLGKEAITSANDLAQSRRELLRLEQAVMRSHDERAAAVPNRSRLRVVYLRSTPGPGTQAGGAASHIKGVVEALESLGARGRSNQQRS